MSEVDLKAKLCDIDDGRFEDIIHTLSIPDDCSKCKYFNLSTEDKTQAYKCYISSSCIAATLSSDVIEHMNQELGWIKV